MYVNTANVCMVCPRYGDETTTIIQFSGSGENSIKVLESSDTVANMMGVKKKIGQWTPMFDEGESKCSNCGEVYLYPSRRGFNYCPNCGADMRKMEIGE